MSRNWSSEMISVYLWTYLNSLLMMAAEKTLVWFLSTNHRTIKALKGCLRRSLIKPPAQSRARSGVSPDCSCLGQVGAWNSSGTEVAQTLRVICHAASLSSWGNSLSFYPVCNPCWFIPASQKVPLEKNNEGKSCCNTNQWKFFDGYN